MPGILQARTLEWVAISFSNAWKWKVKGKSLSHVRLLAMPWTAAYQAPPSMGFSRQEYWSGVPLPSPSADASGKQKWFLYTYVSTDVGSSKKQESSRKTPTSALLTMPRLLILDHRKLWKILKEMGIPDHLTFLLRNLYAGQEATELDMEQQTGSKLGKEYVKALYRHPAYLTYMQITSCEMPGWMRHKLESRLLREISITSDTQMTPPLWQKAKRN